MSKIGKDPKDFDYYEKLISLIEIEMYEVMSHASEAIVCLQGQVAALIEQLRDKGMLEPSDFKEMESRALKWQAKAEQKMEELKNKAIEEKNTPIDRALRKMQEEGISFNDED